MILDNVSSLPLSRLRGALNPRGTLVLNGSGSPGPSRQQGHSRGKLVVTVPETGRRLSLPFNPKLP